MYCRKSTDSEDRQVASLPAQIKELTEIKDREKLNIVDVYQESHSAFHPGRPMFNEMLERIENGEADSVLAWATNRIARNSKDSQPDTRVDPVTRRLYILHKKWL